VQTSEKEKAVLPTRATTFCRKIKRFHQKFLKTSQWFMLMVILWH